MTNIGDVTKINWCAVWVARHDQLPIALGLVELSIRLQHKGTVRAIELPRAGIDRAGFNPAGEIVHRQSSRSKR